MSVSACSRSAPSTAKSSIIRALSLIGVVGFGQLSKRDIHCRSPHRMWLRVPWIEPQNAPLGIREPRRGAVESAVHLGVVFGHAADIGGGDHRGSSLPALEWPGLALFGEGAGGLVEILAEIEL